MTEVSWWTEIEGRAVKVTVPWTMEPYEEEFAAWDRLPWWKKVLAQFGWWV
jgi:hypothetical protein